MRSQLASVSWLEVKERVRHSQMYKAKIAMPSVPTHANANGVDEVIARSSLHCAFLTASSPFVVSPPAVVHVGLAFVEAADTVDSVRLPT